MENEHPDFWSSLCSACERKSWADLLHLLSYTMGTRDFNGNLMDPHPPAVVFRPSMDRHEDIERNLVTLVIDLPGIKRENIQLALLGNELTISGTRLTGFGRDGFVSRERRFGRFTRTVTVTASIKSLNDLNVAMEDGVLIITFPKANA